MINILYKPSNMSPSLITVSKDSFDFQCVVNCDGSSKVVAAVIVITDDAGRTFNITPSITGELYHGDLFTYTYNKNNFIESEQLKPGKTYSWYVRFYQQEIDDTTTTKFINIPMSYGYLSRNNDWETYNSIVAAKTQYENEFLSKFIDGTRNIIRRETEVLFPNATNTPDADNCHAIAVHNTTKLQDGDYVTYSTSTGVNAHAPLVVGQVYRLSNEGIPNSGIDPASGYKLFKLYIDETLVTITTRPAYAEKYHWLTRARQAPDIATKRDTLIGLKENLSTWSLTANIQQQTMMGQLIDKINSLIGRLEEPDDAKDWYSKYSDLMVSTASTNDTVDNPVDFASLLLLFADNWTTWQAQKTDFSHWYVSKKDEFEVGMYFTFNLSQDYLTATAGNNTAGLVGKYFKITAFDKVNYCVTLADTDSALNSLTSRDTLKNNLLVGAKYTVFSTYMDSKSAVFKVMSAPVVSMTKTAGDYSPVGESGDLIALSLTYYNSSTITINATYEQAENISWRSFYFELWKHNIAGNTNILVQTSDTKTNGAITATFTGLNQNLNLIANVNSLPEYYYFKLYITDINNITTAYTNSTTPTFANTNFAIVYDTIANATQPTVSYDEPKGAIRLAWTNPGFGSGVTATYWDIYRLKKTDGAWESSWKHIVKLPAATLSFYDASVSHNHEYKYRIFPVLNKDGAVISAGTYPESLSIITNNWDVQVFDIIPSGTVENLYYVDTANFWNFELDIDLGSMSVNLDKTVYKSLSKYPKVSSGIKNYYTGELNCYLSDVSALEARLDTFEKQNRFKEFVNNGKMKILKDRKGHVLLVDLLTCSFTMDYALAELPIKLSSSWVQIGDTTNLSIVYQ